MASSATDEQRRKEDLELLALFDPDCPQDLSSFQASFSSVSFRASDPSSSSGYTAIDENWTVNLDEETLAYLDEIIAEDEASSRAPCPKPASCDEDGTFSSPRNFKCPMCPKEFYNKAAMRNHGRRHILKLIRCPCGFRGQSPVQKQKHYLYHHVGVSKHKFLASF